MLPLSSISTLTVDEKENPLQCLPPLQLFRACFARGNGPVLPRIAGCLCWFFTMGVCLFFVAGCGERQAGPVVVVYTALDQVYSEQVLKQFEQETGIKVQAVYDTEATKTVGLANRLIAEKSNPQCDVFWNNEIVRTVMLKQQGVLQPYPSPAAQDIPEGLKDREGFWAGFAARARILVCNTKLLKETERPISILECTNARWKGKVALAYPLFGTTATHAAALFTTWGDERAREFYRALKENGVVIVDGNGAVKDMVARSEAPMGFTDTDDAFIASQQGKPVHTVFPDQGTAQFGALIIPNTVSLIKNCPHPEAGKKLIDFLLRRETEKLLAHCGSAQMPVRSGIPVPEGIPNLASIKAMAVDWEKVAAKQSEASEFLSKLFIR